MSVSDDYFTITQATKKFNVSRQTIARWITQRNIPTEKVGREVLIKRNAIYVCPTCGSRRYVNLTNKER